MVALSHPWSRLPIEATIATRAAPDMFSPCTWAQRSLQQRVKFLRNSRFSQEEQQWARSRPRANWRSCGQETHGRWLLYLEEGILGIWQGGHSIKEVIFVHYLPAPIWPLAPGKWWRWSQAIGERGWCAVSVMCQYNAFGLSPSSWVYWGTAKTILPPFIYLLHLRKNFLFKNLLHISLGLAAFIFCLLLIGYHPFAFIVSLLLISCS
jgi:hypothetical protein